MTIVRVGLSENRQFGEGWDAIFAKSKRPKAAKATATRKKKTTKQAKKKK
jgi:hypothetical protein